MDAFSSLLSIIENNLEALAPILAALVGVWASRRMKRRKSAGCDSHDCEHAISNKVSLNLTVQVNGSAKQHLPSTDLTGKDR